jgi:hypothetical protein
MPEVGIYISRIELSHLSLFVQSPLALSRRHFFPLKLAGRNRRRDQSTEGN